MTSYGITKNLGEVSFDAALERVTEALKTEGFGVLTDIDVKQTLKKKLDVDFRNYRILGACNPPLAHEALRKDLSFGLLLPCNVIIYEQDDGTSEVSIINPAEMFKLVDQPDLANLATQVDEKLHRVADQL